MTCKRCRYGKMIKIYNNGDTAPKQLRHLRVCDHCGVIK